jgi:hypothetical protein
VLWLYGAPAALALIPLIMPREWMALVHERLGMGAFPDKPIAEYLARYASAFSAFYGFLLILLATDVHRYARIITFQAIAVAGLSIVGAWVGFRGGMPAWWMIGDVMSCCSFGAAVLWLQRKISVTSRTGEHRG